jgi:hypothetical protein
MEEEEEREVFHEVEVERQVERPPKATPAAHKLREDVRSLIQTGVRPKNSHQFVPILQPLHKVAAAASPESWSSDLLATRDFSVTIKGSSRNGSRDYLRPINWIISSTRSQASFLVALSPYEVNELLPDIQSSRNVHLHIYTPRVRKSMKSFEKLTFYCTPPLPASWAGPSLELKSQLNLVAGQLYLSDHSAYRKLCEFLGLYTDEDRSKEGVFIQSDGFIKRQPQPSKSPFKESPVPFLKDLISLRQKGMGWMPTHMWQIFHGRLLTENDFDDSSFPK